jgi:hypothetical protein
MSPLTNPLEFMYPVPSPEDGNMSNFQNTVLFSVLRILDIGKMVKTW